MLRAHERIRQPPEITKPAEVLAREGERNTEGYFTGEDSMRYVTNLALLRDKRKREAAMEGEKERAAREEIERRLREEMMRVENDGSLEDFIKQKKIEDGENEFVKQIRYDSNQLDITPLMRQIASRIQAENENYDPQLIAQSRAEIEAELREIVVTSARAINNNQSPAQHTTPVKVISNESPLTSSRDEGGGGGRGGEEPARGEGRVVSGIDTATEEFGNSKSKRKTKNGGDNVKRYPGYRPWPSLQDCAAMSLPRALLFTSTWLSVTAKKIRLFWAAHVTF